MTALQNVSENIKTDDRAYSSLEKLKLVHHLNDYFFFFYFMLVLHLSLLV